MSEKIYRFVCDGIGIYEAVDNHCPRDDRRREGKPDGSWLPKIGTEYPGAISFWTERGLDKYFSSGLQEWHRFVVREPLEVLVSDLPTNPLYQDKFQIICESNIEAKKISWNDFAIENSKYPLVDKVLAYILKSKGNKKEILVFEHDKKWSEAGLQVPAGSVDPGEEIERAVLREAQEESGLEKVRVIKKIDEYIMYRNTHEQFNRRHVFLLEPTTEVQESWSHSVQGDGIDKGMNFHFSWMPTSGIETSLAGSMGYSARRIK